MQCGTEAEIKERHRQTERWVGGRWVVGDSERGGEGQRERESEREVRKGGRESSHFSSS